MQWFGVILLLVLFVGLVGLVALPAMPNSVITTTVYTLLGIHTNPAPAASPPPAPTAPDSTPLPQTPAPSPAAPPTAPEPTPAPPAPPPATPPAPVLDTKPLPPQQFAIHPKFKPFAELEPKHYIDRYNNEPSYKQWFDQNFPNITIQQALGYESYTPAPTPAPAPTTPPAPQTPEPTPVAPTQSPAPPTPEPTPVAPTPSPAPPTPEPTPVAPTPSPAPPTPEPTPAHTQTDNSAICDQLVAQLFNIDITDDEFNKLEEDLTTNNCGS